MRAIFAVVLLTFLILHAGQLVGQKWGELDVRVQYEATAARQKRLEKFYEKLSAEAALAAQLKEHQKPKGDAAHLAPNTGGSL